MTNEVTDETTEMSNSLIRSMTSLESSIATGDAPSSGDPTSLNTPISKMGVANTLFLDNAAIKPFSNQPVADIPSHWQSTCFPTTVNTAINTNHHRSTCLPTTTDVVDNSNNWRPTNSSINVGTANNRNCQWLEYLIPNTQLPNIRVSQVTLATITTILTTSDDPNTHLPFTTQNFYGPTPTNLSAYNNMLVQPYLTMQQPNYLYTFHTLNEDCLSRSVTSPFVKEILEYEIPNTTKLLHLKT